MGTNPIAFGAPGLHGDEFMLDMSTTTVAEGKVCCHGNKIVVPHSLNISRGGGGIFKVAIEQSKNKVYFLNLKKKKTDLKAFLKV